MPAHSLLKNQNLEKISGTVEKVTYHNEQNGWSVLKVASFQYPGKQMTVLIHQAHVYAGATMEFWGSWSHHPKHGEQFKAQKSMEKKPASTAALEKYLGSGLIKGVKVITARKIVSYFKDKTLDVFENNIEDLTSVPGIAGKKLEQIKISWNKHRSIRDVMIFLQNYGISTLFATKIFKVYGDQAIKLVSENPYRLAHDIYGIGFFSADKIALSMGFVKDSQLRIEAGIKHILASSRDEGHCFLTQNQIIDKTLDLLKESIEHEKLNSVISELLVSNQVKVRSLKIKTDNKEMFESCYYSKTLYYDELKTSEIVKRLMERKIERDSDRIRSWVKKYCEKHEIHLSEEQNEAVCRIPGHSFSILTGGPGCGKTTCTKVLVELLKAMKLKVTLAAPTGRASQRMTEIIGLESKTIHRLLEWIPSGNTFKHNEENPIQTHFLILDEVSMLDISLASNLLKAVAPITQVLFIGDSDQLPAVGAGNVLRDLLHTHSVPRFKLTKIFRQAKESSIIRFAHEINSGLVPRIISPVKDPKAFQKGVDCLFVDADEATQDQLRFIKRVNQTLGFLDKNRDKQSLLKLEDEWVGRIRKSETGVELDQIYRPECEDVNELKSPVLIIPEKFKNTDLLKLAQAESETAQLKSVLKSIHPWSSIRYGMTAVKTLTRLYTQTIPQWFGRKIEIQVLSPQVRGTMGTMNLNRVLQNTDNPENPSKKQIKIGDKILRQEDRVIQTRNNYDLGIFNGDIGKIADVNPITLDCVVDFYGSSIKRVTLKKENLNELQLAYAITIHKSQGSEFEVVLIPIMGQHFNMLFRNLIYTGLTRAKKLAIFVGSRKALSMAVRQIDNRKRQTALTSLTDNINPSHGD